MSDKDPYSGDGSPQQAAVDDIDPEKHMHETLRRSERRLAAQKQALELAVSGATIGVVLSPVAEEARKQVSGDARVALYIVDPDGAVAFWCHSGDVPGLYERRRWVRDQADEPGVRQGCLHWRADYRRGRDD
jgi:hypothetical protein